MNASIAQVEIVDQNSTFLCLSIIPKPCLAHNTCVLQHLALVHLASAQLDPAQTVASDNRISEQTLATYVQERIWTHSARNKRFRKFVQQSALFRSAKVAEYPELVEWYAAHNDVILEQPISFLIEEEENGEWMAKDEEWHIIHQNYTRDMASYQVSLSRPSCCFRRMCMSVQFKYACVSSNDTSMVQRAYALAAGLCKRLQGCCVLLLAVPSHTASYEQAAHPTAFDFNKDAISLTV